MVEAGSLPLCRWTNTARGCTERSWCLRPCRFSSPDWTKAEVTWSEFSVDPALSKMLGYRPP